MDLFKVCAECEKTRQALADLVMVLAYNRRLVELRDGDLPMDLDDATISCRRCGTTGRILTGEGQALLAILEERVASNLECHRLEKEVSNDPT